MTREDRMDGEGPWILSQVSAVGGEDPLSLFIHRIFAGESGDEQMGITVSCKHITRSKYF